MTLFPPLIIPETLAAGPGPGNTDPRVLAAFANSGIADHMQADVVRGMQECKIMLRALFGTKNVHTYAIAGTGWSGLDCLHSAIQPEDFAADPMHPKPANVTVIEVAHGTSVSGKMVDEALAGQKAMWAAMAHWETGSGRINDIQGFSDACEKHGVMGLIDAVSSLGIEDFNTDDYPGVVGWASCPQKGVLALPLTYAPVTFTDAYIDIVAKRGCSTFVNHPILNARHWSIADGKDVATAGYHQTHSCYAVASFHEALRISLEHGRAKKAADYVFHESVLSEAVTAMGCKVTSNMTSLVVLNLPDALAGREKELVQECRAAGFAIWPTLSEPAQIRIGILNQLSEAAISDIVGRFADAVVHKGANNIDKNAVLNQIKLRFADAKVA
jgi:alanine-glyoxylate transaminase/serine-glyoxylate transaminase/serine-pyruvate transaminase